MKKTITIKETVMKIGTETTSKMTISMSSNLNENSVEGSAAEAIITGKMIGSEEEAIEVGAATGTVKK